MQIRNPYDNEQFSLSKHEMILAVAAETKRHSEKGFSFHCFIVSSQDKYPKTKRSELFVVLNSLKKAYDNNSMPDNSRIQLLVHCGVHWTAVDLLFNRAHGVSAFIIDAAGDDRYLLVLSTVQEIFSTPELPNFKLYLAIRGIQWDMVHCAVFTLHHAFKASKIGDLHSDLESRQAYFAAAQHHNKNYLAVNVNQVPPTLLTVIQKSHSLDDYLKKNTLLIDYKLTKKGLSLSEIVWGNTEQNGKYITNKYIEKVKFKAKKKAEIFYNEHTTEAKLYLRKHISKTMTTLRKPETLPAYHIHQVSGLLTEGPPASNQRDEIALITSSLPATRLSTASLFAAKKTAETTMNLNHKPNTTNDIQTNREPSHLDNKF